MKNDLISRQALCEYALNQKDKSITPNDIMRFPSAQPKERTEERTETHSCDLIERQAAISVIAKWMLNYGGAGEERERNALKKATEDIKELPSAQPERRWIPCSERMPEERQEILATTTDNAWGDVVIIRTYYKEMHKSVIAWMPLPEPYAERRTDG